MSSSLSDRQREVALLLADSRVALQTEHHPQPLSSLCPHQPVPCLTGGLVQHLCPQGNRACRHGCSSICRAWMETLVATFPSGSVRQGVCTATVSNQEQGRPQEDLPELFMSFCFRWGPLGLNISRVDISRFQAQMGTAILYVFIISMPI